MYLICTFISDSVVRAKEKINGFNTVNSPWEKKDIIVSLQNIQYG